MAVAAGSHPTLSRTAGPLRTAVHPHLSEQSPRERCGRAGPSAHQVDSGADAGAAREPRLREVEEYERWVREMIEREHNVLLRDKLVEERRHLHELPAVALPTYTTFTVTVSRWSTIRVVNHTYSVHPD